jgi:hypothetical protein
MPSPSSTHSLRRHLIAITALVVGHVACSSSSASAPVSGDAGDAGPDALPLAHPDAASPKGDAGTHDATTSKDAAAPTDAGSSEAAPVSMDAGAGCGDAASDTQFTCTGDGNSRLECSAGKLVDESCPNGCLREPAGQDSICMGTTSNWSCTGSYGTTAVDDGNYYLTEFGCWVDDAGTHTDPDDNCIPACLAKAQAAGLCDQAGSGPTCEEKLSWYTADGARFGCLQRLRVTNPANGKAVIAIALDYGPGCTGENDVQHAVLDASGLVNDYLFGSAQGRSDMALVHVVEVDDTTPLGPVP